MQGIAGILGEKGAGRVAGPPQGRRRSRRGGRRPPSRPEGGGLRPGGRCGRAGLGGAGGEAAGGWVQGEAGPQGRPGRRPGRRGRPQAAPESRPEGGLPCGPWGGVCRGGTGKRTMHRTAGSPGFKKTLHNFTKLSPVFTEDKKLCQVLFTICGYNGCQ